MAGGSAGWWLGLSSERASSCRRSCSCLSIMSCWRFKSSSCRSARRALSSTASHWWALWLIEGSGGCRCGDCDRWRRARFVRFGRRGRGSRSSMVSGFSLLATSSSLRSRGVRALLRVLAGAIRLLWWRLSTYRPGAAASPCGVCSSPASASFPSSSSPSSTIVASSAVLPSGAFGCFTLRRRTPGFGRFVVCSSSPSFAFPSQAR